MNSKTLCIIALVLLGSCAFSGCGNGGSPGVSFSASSLTFGDQEEGSASEPLLITLTNSGTAPLSITGIAVSANFAETNTCGTTLAAGANCAINVTLVPNTAGSVSGTVTITDNAAGSPQLVSLKGTAVTPSTLTGLCVGTVPNGIVGPGGERCNVSTSKPTSCPVGQPAVTPIAENDVCNSGKSYIVDTSTHCDVPYGGNRGPSGRCQATSSVLSCSVQGQQCGGTLPGCCSGFTCTAGASGSSCQPATGANAKARPSWERGLSDRLR
ncbi:MAG: choice-of-anchor D domain-containing protein [Candidatus Sulfotelmatobacter sp.]